MDATLYGGTGATQVISNADNGTTGFKPDFVWLKARSNGNTHVLTDSVRGISNYLFTNLTSAEQAATAGTAVTSLNSNGFTLGLETSTSGSTNNSGYTYVGWQWQAGQGTTSSNTNGSITSTVSVNATAGFSVVTYAGTGANATIGHGLSTAPQFIAIKIRNNTYSWRNYHASLGNAGYIYFNSSDAYTASSTTFNSTSPTSSVFSIGTEVNTNANGGTFVAYCWAPVAGFSQFGSYTGNGSTDGPFIYTGFRPKFILTKRTDVLSDWWIMDSSRSPYNNAVNTLYPNLSDAEYSYSTGDDFLSNGFKVRNTNGSQNASGGTYIYACFAENPFKYANAR
jgi:hypothetical protein